MTTTPELDERTREGRGLAEVREEEARRARNESQAQGEEYIDDDFPNGKDPATFNHI
jgi:hypothetical protein